MNTSQITTQAEPITVAAAPGCPPRLLGEQPQTREDLAAYRARGGYRPLAGADELLSEVESSGLVGRGGAAFPLAVKLRTVRDNGSRAGGTVAVANGEEGEPASIKDRWLLRNRPHLVLDGLRLAAVIVAADRAYVYVSDPESARSVEAALAELGSELHGITVDLLTVQPGYVAGEETAAVRAINGGPAKPTDRPPRCRRAHSWPPSPERDDRQCSTNCRTAYRSLNCLPCTEFHRTGCEARLWAGTSRACSTDECSRHRWITRPCAGSAAAWAAVRSR